MGQVFSQYSEIRTLLLCILTLGGYLIFKLYQFSNQINQKTEYKIPKLFIVAATLLFAVSHVSLLIGLVHLPDKSVLINAIPLHVVSSAFDVSWILMIRDRMNLISNSNKGDELWLSPLKTSLLHVIYMQYKINKWHQINTN